MSILILPTALQHQMILEKAKNKIGQLVYCSLAGETEKPIISS